MLTPHQIYKELVVEYILDNALSNLSFDKLTRRANIYAVKHTWRKYNEQHNPTDFQSAINHIFGAPHDTRTNR